MKIKYRLIIVFCTFLALSFCSDPDMNDSTSLPTETYISSDHSELKITENSSHYIIEQGAQIEKLVISADSVKVDVENSSTVKSIHFIGSYNNVKLPRRLRNEIKDIIDQGSENTVQYF